MRSLVITFFLLLIVQMQLSVFASGDTDLFSDPESLLPPVQGWSGKSESLMVEKDDPWVTPAELTGLSATPAYDETMAWLRKLVDAAPELEMISIGKSLQGRDFWMVIASTDQAFTPSALKDTGKPLLLAHSGIHAGEIDGKDAGLMLLRDMTVAAKRRIVKKHQLSVYPDTECGWSRTQVGLQPC